MDQKRNNRLMINVKKALIWFFFFLNIAIIFYIWWTKSTYYIHTKESGNLLIAFGRITGLLGEYFLLVQLVLIGRISLIEKVFGFDKMNKFHRYIGYSVLSLLLSHPILLSLGYAKANAVMPIPQFLDFVLHKEDVFPAFIAISLLIFIVIISIALIRKKLRYETWYFIHLLTYLSVGLALSHQLGKADLRAGFPLVYWYIANFSIFGLYLISRLLKPLYLYQKHQFKISRIANETENTCSIYIEGRQLEKFRFKSGQYANINLLTKGMWYSHPFSFSDVFNGEYIRFSIKKSGDYTSKIQDIKIGTKVIIDGPLGAFTEDQAAKDKYIMIAGGIGITPINSLIKSLSDQKKDIHLLYSNKTANDLVFKDELDKIKKVNNNLKISYFLRQKTEGFEQGHIDAEIINRLVPDFRSRELYICGPKFMMKSIVDDLVKNKFPKTNMHFEKFSF